MNSIWQFFSIFQSSTHVQKCLFQCYLNINISEPEKKSYENCYPFIYFLEHAKNYYQLATQAPISIKPILLFYGIVQLLKACLLTVDPDYPESSSVLAHGVTTRKRKKRNYEFLKDEVKIQTSGLFPHFSAKLFNIKHFEVEKYTMNTLFARIPELNQVFKETQKVDQSYKISQSQTHHLLIPLKILDQLHMTHSRFIHFLDQILPSTNKVCEANPINQNQSIEILLNQRLNPIECSPFYYHYIENTFYIPIIREQYIDLNEIMTHYLLLYNLSMISRYETEWWSELLHNYHNYDYPFIDQFLNLTIEKAPYLIYYLLKGKMN